MTDAVWTIAGRVINQIRRDRRTLAMIMVVPLVVMTLIGLSFPERKCWTTSRPPCWPRWRCFSASC